MSTELSDDDVSTAPLGPNSRLFGAVSSSAEDVTSFSRVAIYNYIVATLSAVASSGSASDLNHGTLPLDRLHPHLRDISNILEPTPGDLMSFNGLNWVAVQPDTINGLGAQSATAASIAAVGDAINTTNKRTAKLVFDTTNNRLMVASGPAPDAAWYVADGSLSVTPE